MKQPRGQAATRRWLIVGAVVGLLACLPGREVAAQGGLSAYQILENMIGNKGKVSFEGERKSILYRDGQEAVTKQLIKQQAGGKLRIESTYPPKDQGELLITNGMRRWHYLPDGNLLVMPAIPPPGIASQARKIEMQQLLANNELVREPDEEVAGRQAYVVLVRNRVSNQPRRRLWVDSTRWLELKSQYFDEGGKLVSCTFFTSIAFDPQFSPSEFAAPPPRSLAQQRLQNVEPFWPLLPEQVRSQMRWVRLPRAQDLPKGWVMHGNVTLLPSGDQQAVVLHFTSGVDTFSLFQRQVRPGQEALRSQDLARNAQALRALSAYTWRQGPVEFTLLGQRIAQEDLEALKKAMEKAPQVGQPKSP